jgi:hypothetical protein
MQATQQSANAQRNLWFDTRYGATHHERHEKGSSRVGAAPYREMLVGLTKRPRSNEESKGHASPLWRSWAKISLAVVA